MALFLGVDGGQSGTVAMVGDESGRVLGVGQGPAIRHDGALATAIDVALKAAGGFGPIFEAACFGLSGGTAGREASIREQVRAERYVFTHDAAIALTGALDGKPGIIVIAGTGSIAFGRNAEGREARAGGWGYIFGDEGGAFDLVRQAVRAALRQEEGWGSPTVLREMLLTETGSESANDLMHRFYTPGYPRERIAALAPMIDHAATAGDAVAQDLLKSAAQELAGLAGVVRRRIFSTEERVELSYSGGVFRSEVLLARFRMLVELDERNSCIAPLRCPAAGALMEAYRAAGVHCSLKIVGQLQFDK